MDFDELINKQAFFGNANICAWGVVIYTMQALCRWSYKEKTMDMMCANIWHHDGDIEAGVRCQFSPSLAKKSGYIQILVWEGNYVVT